MANSLVAAVENNKTDSGATNADGSFNIVPCGNQTDPTSAANDCNYSDLFQLGSNIINAGFSIMTLILVLVVIYTGIRYMAGKGVPEAIIKARRNFLSFLIGLIIMLTAWAVVNYLVEQFLNTEVIDNPFAPGGIADEAVKMR